MMGLGSSTGALHLQQADGRAGIVYFDQGALVSCTELDTEALTLGHVLQQLDVATGRQVEHTFHLETHDPLGKLIVEGKTDLEILTDEQPSDALRTQTLWTTRHIALC